MLALRCLVWGICTGFSLVSDAFLLWRDVCGGSLEGEVLVVVDCADGVLVGAAVAG